MALFEEALAGMRKGEKWKLPDWGDSWSFDGLRSSVGRYRQIPGGWLSSEKWERVPEPRNFHAAVDLMSACGRHQRCRTSGRIWCRYGDALMLWNPAEDESRWLRVDEINATDWEDA